MAAPQSERLGIVSMVTIKNLVKRFGTEFVAVAGVSFTAEEGAITTLLGPSGCGKTTTLRSIAGLETPSEGEIGFGDRVVYSSAAGIDIPTERRDIGMMFQNYALWPHMTIADNVAFGLRLRKLSNVEVEQRVKHVLDMVKLASRAGAYPGELSGGQQQRVALARALAYNPNILLLDEPLANLDAKLREEMRFELVELQKRTGLTALYVTHDQSEAMTLSQKIIVMQDGVIAHQGSPEEIYEKPRTRFVAEFVGASNLMRIKDVHAETQGISAETDYGRLQAHAAGRENAQYFMIRPEDVEVEVNGMNGRSNQIRATVTGRVYQGENVVLHLLPKQGASNNAASEALSEAGAIRAHVRRDHPARPGAEVIVGLPPERLIVLQG